MTEPGDAPAPGGRPPPFARVLAPGRDVLAAELERFGVPADTRDEVLARETRCAVVIAGLDSCERSPLLAAARAQQLAVFQRAGSALLVGPALLLREVARDLPPEISAPLAIAADLFRGAWGVPRRVLRHARGMLGLDRPVVMGVVNVTPDSFSDGGRTLEPAAAIERARTLVAEGAAIVDVGGESTRPGAAPVPLEEEIRRVIPVVEALAALPVPISIDTRKPEVAALALRTGAAIVNDVSGLAGRMRSVVASAGAGAIIVHMRGTPETMQDDPRYQDLLGEVGGFLVARAAEAEAAGIAPDAIAIDPGFGFGKTAGHNLEILRRLGELAALGRPLAVGVSRKSMLGKLTGRQVPAERLAASLAATTLAIERGAAIIRTHDVRETVDAVKVAAALLPGPSGV